MADLIARIEAQLRPRFAATPWIVAWDVLASATGMVDGLRRLGAPDVLVVAGSRGTGPAPDAPCVVLGAAGGTMMEGIRAAERAVADLSPEAAEAIERFDPERRARVLRPMFGGLDTVADRPVYGTRPRGWRDLEDKTVCDGLWDAAGVSRAPSRVVPVDADALRLAARALDRGAGTVWAADNRLGFHGGAELTRWVVDDRDVDEAVALFAACAWRVRVMPFVEGRPCSIHGWVLGDRVLAFRPIEMVVLRRRRRFRYAGCASFWDPPHAVRTAMRRVVRRVGRHLRDSVGYRGAFTVDGVASVDGFVPTELNPRFGAGLQVVAGGIGIPLYLLNCATIAGELPAIARNMERPLLRRIDRHRAANCHVGIETRVEQERSLPFHMSGERAEPSSTLAADGQLLLGPSPVGGFLRVLLNPARTPVGRSVADRVAAALALGAEVFDVDAADFVAAPDVA